MKKKQFLLPLLMAIVMVAISPQKVWALGGSGTSSDPYTIASADDLKEFADIVNGTNGKTRNVAACGKLTADIYLEAWTDYMMGSSSNPFTGSFDGQGKKIEGIGMIVKKQHAGMFAYVKDATIKNFTITGDASSNTGQTGEGTGIGMVVGRAEGATKILDIVSSVNYKPKIRNYHPIHD